MKRALTLLLVCYLGVAVMIWAGDRLGHLRFLVLATIGVCGFAAFHALYRWSESEGESRKARLAVRSLVWLFVLASAGGLAFKIITQVVALLG